MVNFLLVIIPSVFFLLIKMAFSGIRFSDTNVYFYTATELLRGKVLYKDIFFTNLPLFPSISSLYAFLIGRKIEWYYITAALEVVVTGMLIFFITFKKTNNRLYSFISQCLYLFSFIILSTSDYQTGVFLASFFSVLAYLCYEKKQNFLTGVFLGCMLLTKAYYLPVAMAFFMYLFIKERDRFIKTLSGFLIICALVLFPSVITARKEFVKDVIFYSLFRSQGIDKLRIISFFITHDVILFFLFIFTLLFPKKNILFFLTITLSLLFIVFFQDIYFLYLNILVPYLIFSFPDFLITINHQLKKYEFLPYFTICVFLIINAITYLKGYARLQKLDNLQEILAIIKEAKPEYLYGTMEITPAFSYLSNVPLFDNIIDTNDNLFYKGVLNSNTLTRRLLSKKTIIVTKGLYYPSDNINKPITGAVVDEGQVLKYCTKLYTTPIKTEGLVNSITLFKCY